MGGGQGSEYWGGGAKVGGGKFFDVCKLIGASPSQCQIITFLTLKTDSIEKLE